MCHRLQNSEMDFEVYGSLKFSMYRNPKIRPRPIAMSE